MTDEYGGERTLLYILVGAGIMLLAYLFFKDQFSKGNQTQSLSSLYDLTIQTNELKEQMNMYNYKLDSLLGNQSNTLQSSQDLNKLQINSLKSVNVKSMDNKVENAIRQMKFNMQ